MEMERFTIVENAKCDTCGGVTTCFVWYQLADSGEAHKFLTECAECDCDRHHDPDAVVPMETDPRAASTMEEIENWGKVMSDKDLDWLDFGKYESNVKFDIKNATCVLPSNHHEMMRGEHWSDEVTRFVDHWIIVREDGKPMLNGTLGDFEQQLRELVDARTDQDS